MNKSENSATPQISLQLLLNPKRVGGYMIEVGMSLLKSWKQFFSMTNRLPLVCSLAARFPSVRRLPASDSAASIRLRWG